jgi:hypothetical protein
MNAALILLFNFYLLKLLIFYKLTDYSIAASLALAHSNMMDM